MSTSLTGTTALITGASGGIGAATALSLAAQGASVALVARRKDRLDDLAARIRATGGTVLAIEADIVDRLQATAAVEQTIAAFGGLDTLVNNAGIMLLGRVSLIEPGPVATELFTHIRPEILEASREAFANATLLHAEDIADTITYVVSRPARVVMSEVLVRPDGSQW
ncbi:SDR family NAD(P)-dependent oxidoreductase [Actinoplanes sp. CA-252034]|uniref:SDR family NAD(P)-dependent oxidoreductase n=1 Tax=Actinoplanes sp. CA-252034 TaxID=3239906 RepID=UPI003D99CFA9